MLYSVWAIEGLFELSERWMSFRPLFFFFAELVTQPVMRVSETTVRVQSSVVFTCFSDNTGVDIRWLFNKQSLQLTERMSLSPSKCQLRIHTVRKEDAGEYQCEAFNPVSSKTSLPVILAVMIEWPVLSCYNRAGHFCIEMSTPTHPCQLQISIHSYGQLSISPIPPHTWFWCPPFSPTSPLLPSSLPPPTSDTYFVWYRDLQGSDYMLNRL